MVMPHTDMYDIIIIGAGPAGLTAAIYARRAEKSVLIIEKGALGGQMTYSPKIENYPGFSELSGNELADKMVEQVLSFGADIEMETVTEIRSNGATKSVITENGEYEAKAVIIASGAQHRHLGLEGEEELIGSGISFCAVCDGAFYKGQTVAVVGGGNSAMQEALLLSESCKKVYMIQNLAVLTGEEALRAKIAKKQNIEVIYSTVVSAYLSNNGSVNGIKLHNTELNSFSSLSADGVFIAIGLIPATDEYKELIELDKYGYVAATESCKTNVPGIFTAGDCRQKTVRQITTAVADGATAALAASRYTDE